MCEIGRVPVQAPGQAHGHSRFWAGVCYTVKLLSWESMGEAKLPEP